MKGKPTKPSTPRIPAPNKRCSSSSSSPLPYVEIFLTCTVTGTDGRVTDVCDWNDACPTPARRRKVKIANVTEVRFSANKPFLFIPLDPAQWSPRANPVFFYRSDKVTWGALESSATGSAHTLRVGISGSPGNVLKYGILSLSDLEATKARKGPRPTIPQPNLARATIILE